MSATKKEYYFSVVVPVYNEEENINICYNQITKTLDEAGKSVEFVFVNDGSKDKSLQVLTELAAANTNVKVVNLSRNFGQETAISAGLNYAGGQLIYIIDCDLQDPPYVMLELYNKQQEGYDVVYGVRKKRKNETVLKKITSALYYRFFRRWTGLNMPKDAGLFRIITRQVKDEIINLKEKHQFIRAANTWVGFKQTGVEFVREGRVHGKTKYNYKKLTNLALNSVVSYSTMPVNLIFKVAVAIAMLSVAAFVTFGALAIAGIYLAVGFWLIPTITICTALLMLAISALMMYLTRTFQETQNRPNYIVESTLNL